MSQIKIYSQRISEDDLKSYLGHPFSEMIKFVVDLRKGTIALGGQLHSDAEALLLKEKSKQADLWGGNFYPARPKSDQIEYTSMINIRPAVKNNSMEVRDEKIRNQMKDIVGRLLP